MQMNQCVKCGCNADNYEYDGQSYCRHCALELLGELKKRYHNGETDLGWKIEDFWQQGLWDENVRSDLSPFPESWLEEEEFLEQNDADSSEWHWRAFREDAKEIVRRFIQDHLDGDINALKDFDMRTLCGNTKYGCETVKDFDCDDTYIARAIYALLWRDVFPDMELSEIGNRGKLYRGDTMNSFHSIFGRQIKNNPTHFEGIDKFAPIDDELYDRIRQFHRMVHSIGNYVVLPNSGFWTKDQSGKYIFVSLNTYRGRHEEWHDYFDQFMIALEACMTDKPEHDPTLHRLVYDYNAQQLENYKGQEGFTRLARGLFLDDYLTEEGHACNLFADANGKVRFHWESSPIPSRKVYLEGVINYLEHSERIILHRAAQIIERLQYIL